MCALFFSKLTFQLCQVAEYRSYQYSDTDQRTLATDARNSDARVKKVDRTLYRLYSLLVSYSWVFNLLSFTLIGYFILVLASTRNVTKVPDLNKKNLYSDKALFLLA